MVHGTTIEVIAEPTRRRIMDALLDGELPVADLVDRLGLPQPAVSKHLRVLRDAGLVAARPDGQRRMYQLQPDTLIELDTWLEPYRQMWRESLDSLERHLSSRPTSPAKRRKQ